MTSKTKDQIKAFFQTSDKPTESQFIDFIDSYVDKSGPIGQIETAASAGNTGFAFCSGGRGEVIGLGPARDAMGITVYTTALVTQLLGGTILTTAGTSAIASDTIRAALATTVQAVSGQAVGSLMDPVLVRNAIEGNRASGQAIQRSLITSFSGSITSISGSSIPVDNSTPLVSEGTELFSTTITPTSTASKIRVRVCFFGTASSAMEIVVTGFRGSTLVATGYQNRGVDGPVYFDFEDSPSSITTLTYSIRCGVTAGTLTLNSMNSANFGGTLVSFMLVEEIKA